MLRNDPTFAFAMVASVLLHAATWLVLTGKYGGDAVSARPAKVAKLPRAEPSPLELVFGDRRGTGDASNTRPGNETLLSRDGAQQAFLSRDPIGAGRVGDEPSMSVLPRAAFVRPPPPPAAPRTAILGLGTVVQPRPMPTVRRVPTPPTAPPTQSTAPPADPAIMSDSESDPFTRNPNRVEFRDGRVDVRSGRKVKTVRPRLSLVAQVDLMSSPSRQMRVRLHVTAAGDIRRVEIVKSTGSESADQEVKIALYQWWVEPTKNLAGIAVADAIEFAITWH